jgi:two-component system sensor histidine kinase CreC
MLTLTELEARRTLASRDPVALGSVVRTIVEELEPVLLKRHLAIDIQIPEDMFVPGDPLLLHLAVSNLMQNAVDFSPVNGTITVTCSRLRNTIELCIDDEGPGIPEFARTRVFEKFFSLERPNTGRKSTGLGLNFVNEVASLHSGSASVTNRTDRGLRAVMRLPVE